MSPDDLTTPRVCRRLDDAEAAAVEDLVRRAAQVDTVGPLNEQALLRLRGETGHVQHVLAYVDSRLVAYAQLDGSEPDAELSAECVVDPGHRQRGWGTAVVTQLLDLAGDTPLRAWAHGDHPAAARLAARMGFERVRALWQLRRRLGADAAAAGLPAVRLPADVVVRTFEVGRDEQAWLGLNARAFAHHPEQGSLDADDLTQRIESDWFDADGVFLAERAAAGERRLVGFHWTKVGPGADGPIGEVYVVGVDPDEQGSGLGSALTLIGLHHLAERGAAEVLLYVEADNAAAVRVYERLGFGHVGTDTQYRHPVRPDPAP